MLILFYRKTEEQKVGCVCGKQVHGEHPQSENSTSETAQSLRLFEHHYDATHIHTQNSHLT